MNKQKILGFMLLVNVMQTGMVFSHIQNSHCRTLDPMVDFRAPQSLTELLQEGLITVEGILHGASENISEVESFYKSTWGTNLLLTRKLCLYSSSSVEQPNITISNETHKFSIGAPFCIHSCARLRTGEFLRNW